MLRVIKIHTSHNGVRVLRVKCWVVKCWGLKVVECWGLIWGLASHCEGDSEGIALHVVLCTSAIAVHKEGQVYVQEKPVWPGF